MRFFRKHNLLEGARAGVMFSVRRRDEDLRYVGGNGVELERCLFEYRRFRLGFRLNAGSRSRLDGWSGFGFEQTALGGIYCAAAGFAFAQCDQRVEHIRAAPAAHVSLSGAQVHGRHDQCQRAFGADSEQADSPRGRCYARRLPVSAVQPSRDANGAISNHGACARVTSSACALNRPASTILPPGRVSAAKRGARSQSGPHRMLASRMSAPTGRAASESTTRTEFSTALATALSCVAVSAWGSMSKAHASRAPSFTAATASTPEPQP